MQIAQMYSSYYEHYMDFMTDNMACPMCFSHMSNYCVDCKMTSVEIASRLAAEDVRELAGLEAV